MIVEMVETDGEWLSKQFEKNLDLRTPKKPHQELLLLNKIPNILIRENGNLIGFCSLRRRIGCIELCSLVVDEDHRGKGISHKLVFSAWDRWRQDPIIHGKSVIPSVNLAAAIRDDEIEEEFDVLPMIAFTRNVAAAAAFNRAGFKIMSPKRRWWTLGLIRHKYGALSTKTMFSILLNRLFKTVFIVLIGEKLPKNAKKVNFVKTWFQKRRRVFHYLSNLNQYELFVLDPKKVDCPPIKTEEEKQNINSKIQSFGMNFIDGEKLIKKGADISETKNWDDGASKNSNEKLPLINLSEEE